ncbi:enhancer of mRNA-decapping protein 4 homolog Ge-1 isoform 1-T1 [Aphomia sociella]
MQPMTMLPKLSDTTQTISFSEGDGVCSAEVYATDVIVSTNAGTHKHGSSKVKLRNLVDYNWEPKFYHGQLLAIHISGKYMAYSIKAINPLNPSSWSGMVRVVYNPEPGTERRALIKGMKGVVQDLSFAHIQSQVVLACIDEQGNFYVHEIEANDAGIRCVLVAEVREDTGAGGGAARVVWCPYIPDEDDDAPDDDVARLLLTTHHNLARMWNMRIIVSQVAATECVGSARALCSGGAGVLTAADHAAAVVDAAFSPDGTALATASADGFVMFFQVYMHNESSPRCLHKWQPHGGKPLSCLFFLDNHKNYNTDVQFWKFAVTGAENNTTIKIWSCKSWNCLQTISFTPSIAPEQPVLGLKAMLDTSASYLVLSDYETRSLYVLNMTWDVDDTTAYCKSISEFLLPYPVLSFCIADAEEEQVKCESSCDDPFHQNGSSGDTRDSPDDFDLHHDEGVPAGAAAAGGRRARLRLYIVQPRGLQEGELVYEPPRTVTGLSEITLEDNSEDPTPTTIPSSILQQQSQQLKNLLMRSQTQPGSLIGQRPESPTAPPQLNLMTPDAFSSPGKREEDDPPLSATPDVSGKSRSSVGGACSETSLGNASLGAAAAGTGVGLDKPASGGSSPSREVQEIMAHNEHYYKDVDGEEEEGQSSQSPAAEPEARAGAPDVACDAELYATDATHTPIAHAHAHAHAHTNSDTSWPQISLAQITEANQRKASSDKSSSQSLNASLGARAASPRNERLERLEQLEHKIDKLTDLVMSQSRELRALRSSAGSPRTLIDGALHEHAQRTAAAVEAALADGWERFARVGEAASARAATAAGVGAARALEPLVAALQHELAAKLTATDHLLRDNIDKLVNSKSVMERLSTSVATSLTDMVRESFRTALFDSVVPVMEKAHQQIFRQINQAFQNGTKEFAANTEAAARAAAERGGAAATASLRAALERHAGALAAASTQPPAHALTAALQDAAHRYVWCGGATRCSAAATRGRAGRREHAAARARAHRRAAGRRAQCAGEGTGVVA